MNILNKEQESRDLDRLQQETVVETKEITGMILGPPLLRKPQEAQLDGREVRPSSCCTTPHPRASLFPTYLFVNGNECPLSNAKFQNKFIL